MTPWLEGPATGREPWTEEGITNVVLELLEREERLDGYRQEVERRLGARLVREWEDDYERFFAHVEESFDRGEDAAWCVEGWMALIP